MWYVIELVESMVRSTLLHNHCSKVVPLVENEIMWVRKANLYLELC